MTVTRTTRVVGLLAPDMTRASWRESLAGTPAAVDADVAFDRIAASQVSHAFARSIFRHESSDGTKGICFEHQTKSPGNTRSSRTGKGTVLQIPGRGPFVRYDTWADGWEDLAFRIVDPAFAYAKAGAVTIETIIPIWAPASDNNVPESYIAAVVRTMNAWESQPGEEDQPMARPIIALAAGHHNTNKGGAVGEYERVGPLTREIAKQLRAHGGFDVRVITPNDGMGDFPGGLQDVAREAVRLNADLFLEVHFQGVGNVTARGCFSIYPDWPPDIDTDVRDRFGPDVAQRIRSATGIPLWGNGTMSEKNTGVGGQGFRLGAFGASASARLTMTRTLIEYGTLTNAADKAIIDAPGFNEKAARATVAAIAAFYGLAIEQPGGGGGTPLPPVTNGDLPPARPDPWRDWAGGNPYGSWWILDAFVANIGINGGFNTVGFVLGPAFAEPQPDGRSFVVQYFERAKLEMHPDTSIHRALIGRDEYWRRYPERRAA